MTKEQFEELRKQYDGDDFDKLVIKAYTDILCGRKFVVGDTNTTWWFAPDLSGKSHRLHISQVGESVGRVDSYSFIVIDKEIHIHIFPNNYSFVRYPEDSKTLCVELKSGDKTILLREIFD